MRNTLLLLTLHYFINCCRLWTAELKSRLPFELRRELFFKCTEDSLRSRDWQRGPEALGNPAKDCSTRRAETLGARFPLGLEPRGNPTAEAMERSAGDRTASALFAGFRALGLFSNDIPHVVRFSALKRRFYVTTCVGKSFHTYDVSDFFHPLPGNHPPRPPTLWQSRSAPSPTKGFRHRITSTC